MSIATDGLLKCSAAPVVISFLSSSDFNILPPFVLGSSIGKLDGVRVGIFKPKLP